MRYFDLSFMNSATKNNHLDKKVIKLSLLWNTNCEPVKHGTVTKLSCSHFIMLFSFNRMHLSQESRLVKIKLLRFLKKKKTILLKFVVYVAAVTGNCMISSILLPTFIQRYVTFACSVTGRFWKPNFSNNESSLYFNNIE